MSVLEGARGRASERGAQIGSPPLGLRGACRYRARARLRCVCAVCTSQEQIFSRGRPARLCCDSRARARESEKSGREGERKQGPAIERRLAKGDCLSLPTCITIQSMISITQASGMLPDLMDTFTPCLRVDRRSAVQKGRAV